jgi:ubiquitin-small subunit ribosomal protein S27Ae
MAIKSKIKGKRKHKNKKTSKRYTKYKIEGEKVIRDKCCPRCGQGFFLASGKDRLYCGRCHYTEFEKKSVEIKLK